MKIPRELGNAFSLGRVLRDFGVTQFASVKYIYYGRLGDRINRSRYRIQCSTKNGNITIHWKESEANILEQRMNDCCANKAIINSGLILNRNLMLKRMACKRNLRKCVSSVLTYRAILAAFVKLGPFRCEKPRMLPRGPNLITACTSSASME